MNDKKVYRAIGMMSGTSLDAVDIALIETDGYHHIKPIAASSFPYSAQERETVKACFGKSTATAEAINIITSAHIKALQNFGHQADLIGFHGQTIFHDPANRLTVQIGEAQKIADTLQTPVIADLRQNDVKHGGQGAPLLPLYHRARALAASLPLPAAIINIGGVSNITWINGAEDHEILAFDCGPGNALLDDFILSRTDQPFDKDGTMAAAGKADQTLIDQWLGAPYFTQKPPKSLDRDAWNTSAAADIKTENGAATLLGFTVQAIAQGLKQCPATPKALYITGGGRHNAHMMKQLENISQIKTSPVESLGWDGDAMEAEGFAYLAVRSKLGLPITLPSTTGAAKALSGGHEYTPASGLSALSNSK